MYDRYSLARILRRAGFGDPTAMGAHESKIRAGGRTVWIPNPTGRFISRTPYSWKPSRCEGSPLFSALHKYSAN
jgi:hypothetical protein